MLFLEADEKFAIIDSQTHHNISLPMQKSSKKGDDYGTFRSIFDDNELALLDFSQNGSIYLYDSKKWVEAIVRAHSTFELKFDDAKIVLYTMGKCYREYSVLNFVYPKNPFDAGIFCYHLFQYKDDKWPLLILNPKLTWI